MPRLVAHRPLTNRVAGHWHQDPLLEWRLSSSTTSRCSVNILAKTNADGEHQTGVSPDDDCDLMRRVRNGDDEALAKLFRRYARLVRAVGWKILRDASEADDVLQEVFLDIHAHCHKFDKSKCSVHGWITHIACCRAIDRRRRLTARRFYSSVSLDWERQLFSQRADQAWRHNSFELRFGKTELQLMLDSLSDNQRETLRLFFYEGFSFEEIAEQMGQSLANVRHLYYRGLNHLRKQLQKKNGGKL